MDIRIVVLHRGWVVVGEYAATLDEVTITNGAVLRRWGTTRGLGDIAENGPTNETRLDWCPTVREHPLGVVFTMDCVEEKWTEVLRKKTS